MDRVKVLPLGAILFSLCSGGDTNILLLVVLGFEGETWHHQIARCGGSKLAPETLLHCSSLSTSVFAWDHSAPAVLVPLLRNLLTC